MKSILDRMSLSVYIHGHYYRSGDRFLNTDGSEGEIREVFPDGSVSWRLINNSRVRGTAAGGSNLILWDKIIPLKINNEINNR